MASASTDNLPYVQNMEGARWSSSALDSTGPITTLGFGRTRLSELTPEGEPRA